MARPDTETELLRVVANAFPQSVDRLRGQVEALTALTNLQNERVRENTDAITQNTNARGSGLSQAATVGRSILSTIGGGLFLSPLISGIARLFRGSPDNEADPIAPAARPKPLNLEAAVLPDARIGALNLDQYGKPRQFSPARVDFTTLASSPTASDARLASPEANSGYGRGSGFDPLGASPHLTGPTAPTNVTIQIQALDSRSILDRSDEIARALREAMLHSHAVNDVISEG